MAPAPPPPAPPGGPRGPAAATAARPARPATPAGPPKADINLYVTGTRNNLRVRLTFYTNGAGQTRNFTLCFGTPSDPCGFHVQDPTNPGHRYKVNVVGGSGIKDNINLSAYPQFTKVGIIKPDGSELSVDIPNDPPVLTAASPLELEKVILGTPQMLTAPNACPRQYRISVRAVSPSGKGVPGHNLEWTFGRQTGNITTSRTAGREGFRDITLRVNHDDVGPDKATLNLEVRSMSYGEKSAAVALPAPPKPLTARTPWQQIVDGLMGR